MHVYIIIFWVSALFSVHSVSTDEKFQTPPHLRWTSYMPRRVSVVLPFVV